MIKTIFILTIITVSLNASAWRLVWDEGANKSNCAEFSGYKINYGTQSGTYTEEVNAGNVLNYQIASLPLNQNYITYFFVVNAYKLDNSLCSTTYTNEVAWTTGVLSTPTPPTGIIVASLLQDILVRAKVATGVNGETTYFTATDTKSLEKAKNFRKHFERVESINPAIVTTKDLRNKLKGVIFNNEEVVTLGKNIKAIFDDRKPLGIKNIVVIDGQMSLVKDADSITHVLLKE